MSLIRLGAGTAGTAVDVLADAFRDYPAMRYILGPAPDYDRRLGTLIRFFVAARVLCREPILAVEDEHGVAAVALVTPPGDRPVSPELDALREETWRTLGPDALARYRSFAGATHPFLPPQPHHHLNMIGVRSSRMGHGHARTLLEAVHDLAEGDGASTGVSLSTEVERNVGFYLKFGYELRGHVLAADRLETWVFFRPRRG